MARGRRVFRTGRLAFAVAAALVAAAPGSAQEAPVLETAPLLTLDRERLYLESDFGKAAVERERAALAALEQENRAIEAELVAEEQALTKARATLAPAEFTKQADAFDAKVEKIRADQDAKAKTLTDAREKDRQAFLQVVVPVLGEILGDKRATAILDKNLVVLSLSAVDITDEAISRVNDALKEAPPPEPAAPSP